MTDARSGIPVGCAPASTAISFEGVGKRYRLGAGVTSVREAVGLGASRLLGGQRARGHDEIWALRDVTFDLPVGEGLGVIGRNGSGKTTMLKLLAGVTRPTVGRIEASGRIGSLIELGAGFHPDLTGRENVFLNGQIMGMSRRTIAARYDEIVEFAELAQFMDTPVKRYSSGMYARLGFAVAAHMDPDILLIDEVLSVGDASFQRRSAERMRALVNSGKTVVFVSHNLIAVERMCSRVLWLEGGCVGRLASAPEAIHAYLDGEETRLLGVAVAPQSGRHLRVDRVDMLDGDGRPVDTYATGQDIRVAVHFTAIEPLRQARFNLGVSRGEGTLFTANMGLDGTSVTRDAGPGALHCTWRSVPLMAGLYQVFGEVWAQSGYDLLAPWSEWARFRIADARPSPGSNAGESTSRLQGGPPVAVQFDWREAS